MPDAAAPADPLTVDLLELRGPTITLRIPHSRDSLALLELASDPEVTQWFSWGPYRAEGDARSYLDRLPGQRKSGTQLDLIQVLRGHGPIGITGLSEFSYRDRRTMVGSWLGKPWWGSGANTESKALMCYLAFELLGMERVGAYANVANGRSHRALEKVGFQHEGVLKGWHRHGDRQLDVGVYGMLAADWRRGPMQEIGIEVLGAPPPAFLVAKAS
jgi:ribosomal-protein-alanine N-acetyltransferase